jgi:SNF family Na+-dependent transporter
MWVEWTLGRYGGGFEHSTAPGIFYRLWNKNRFIKYFGVIGIFGPLVIFIYYTYIESWTLAYSFFSVTGKLKGLADQAMMKDFLTEFQGIATEKAEHFAGIRTAYVFFIITFVLNILVVYYGIRKGIERLCNWALPILFFCGIALFIRVLTLGAPDPSRPEWNVANGFGFLWNPDFSRLAEARVWLDAAGQIFFTLSVGIGVILTYASYLSKGDDVVLSGLTASGTNELAEVILGGSIIIPAAFVFFGPASMQDIAKSGTFNLGFVTMPVVLNNLPLAGVFGLVWFLLLFLAGVTSSVSLAQPVIAFLEDEFDISRKRAVAIFAAATFVLCQFPVFFLQNGVVDELDFWGGRFFLVLFATVEVILFAWVFGMEKAWDEIHHGAEMTMPKIYKFVIKYVTPLFLVFILGMYFWQELIPMLKLEKVSEADKPYVLATRAGLILCFIVLAVLVKLAWKKKNYQLEETP